MAKRCKHEFTRLRFRDGSERQGFGPIHETVGWMLGTIVSARCRDDGDLRECGAQLALGPSNDEPAEVQVGIRAAAIAVDSVSDPDLHDYRTMDWIGWDSHEGRVADELTSETAAGWLARELATHDSRETRDADADAWPWDVNRPLAEQQDGIRLHYDAVGALCDLVKEAGGVMTLHGKPIDADGLRAAASNSAASRLVDLLAATQDDAPPSADPALQAAAARYLASDEGKAHMAERDDTSPPTEAGFALVEKMARPAVDHGGAK
jgi:hypothetical protein